VIHAIAQPQHQPEALTWFQTYGVEFRASIPQAVIVLRT